MSSEPAPTPETDPMETMTLRIPRSVRGRLEKVRLKQALLDERGRAVPAAVLGRLWLEAGLVAAEARVAQEPAPASRG